MINTENRVGERVVYKRFLKNLKKYLDVAPEADKQRCQILIDKINLQCAKDETRPPADHLKRPKTCIGIRDEKLDDPYTTSYTTHYPWRKVPYVTETSPTRRWDESDGVLPQQVYASLPETQYDDEFYAKPPTKAEPIRSGTASGQRRNNPHPPKAFMVWRFARQYERDERTPLSLNYLPTKEQHSPKPMESTIRTLNEEELRKVMRSRYKSTYQADFLGSPQGYSVQSAYISPPSWKSKVPYSTETIQRKSYQTPQQQPNLKTFTDRYGASIPYRKPAETVIPETGTSALHRDLGVITQYHTDYCEPHHQE